MEEVFFCVQKCEDCRKNSVSPNTLRQHLHLRMIIMYLIKNPMCSPMVIKGGGEKSGKMVYRVYIDMIFAVNLLMDLAVLAMLNQLFSYRADFKHMLKGAFVGALWACILAAISGDPSILQMCRDLCGGSERCHGSCCLWHKKQKRDFTGSRGNLP